MNFARLTTVPFAAPLVILFAVLTVGHSIANGQGASAGQSSPGSPDNRTPMLATAEEEMRAKREIHFADKAHKENVERARDLASLGASLDEAFKEKKYLDSADIKKLEKAEKLAKRLREAAGGEEDDVESGKPPADLGVAMCRLSELAASLKDRVEKTPKRVVSAAIIDETNVLLELIRTIRVMQPKT